MLPLPLAIHKWVLYHCPAIHVEDVLCMMGWAEKDMFQDLHVGIA